jgi:hypothetical protein
VAITESGPACGPVTCPRGPPAKLSPATVGSQVRKPQSTSMPQPHDHVRHAL